MRMNVWRLVLVLFLLMAAPPFLSTVPAAEDYEEMSTVDRLYLKGIISEIIPAENMIVVRPLKGRKVDIVVTPDTIFEGFRGIDSLVEKQEVKVWYFPEGQANAALRIEKTVDLGC